VSTNVAADAGVEHSLNYARKAIREMTAFGKLRLEEQDARGKTDTEAEGGEVVQDANISSTTSAGDSESTELVPSASASSDSGGQVSAGGNGTGSVQSSSASVEVAAEKQITTAEGIDGIAVCLT